MPKEKLPKQIKEAASEYSKLDRKANDATNAANRQKTVLRNEVKNYWTENQLPVGSYIHAGGMKIRYETNETSHINPEKIMELYENEDIDRDQFLRMIKIGVTEAKNIIGGDQVADFTETVPGKNVDIRLSELPVENIEDEFIMNTHKIKRRVQRRKVFGKGQDKKQTTGTSSRAKRRIRTKK